jgi:tripartite-type tricarboxylate transporter receptor subunit TctC
MKRTWIIYIIVAFIMLSSTCWAAEDYPKKPIEIIVPYPAGGTTDLSARIIGEKFKEYLGVPIVVINKPGGGGAVGAAYAIESTPDGYTILAHTFGVVLRPLFELSVPYRYNQLKPIGVLGPFEHVVSINKDLPIKNLPELIAYAKDHPGTLSYSVSGRGASSYISIELLKIRTKLTDLHLQAVSYPGDPAALLALRGKQVQMSVTTTSMALPHIKSKEIRAITILSKERDLLLPEVPTSIEQGFPDVLATSYYLYFAPLKTPGPIVEKLEKTLEKALQDKGVQEKLKKIEMTVGFKNSTETQALMDSEYNKWSQLVKDGKLIAK